MAQAQLQKRSRHPRWSVNITPVERMGRIAFGGIAAIVGFELAFAAATAIGVALSLLLVAAGLDLVVTGALGHCPLYQKLGYVPASLPKGDPHDPA